MTAAIWTEGDGPAHGVAGLRVTGIRARERERGEIGAEALAAAFARQRDLISALHCPGEQRRFELRCIVNPSGDAPGRGVIMMFLLARVEGTSAIDAHERTSGAILDLHTQVRALGDGYDCAWVSRQDELAYALQPFRIASLAEIQRRDAILSAGSLGWSRGARIGFSEPSAQPKGDDVLYHTYRFIPRDTNLYELYGLLLAQPSPLLVSIQLEPTALSAPERDALRTGVARAERWIDHKHNEITEDAARTVKGDIIALAREKLVQLERLEDAAFRMRIRVASPLPLRAAIVESVAQRITCAAGTGADATTVSFRGGAEWHMVPESTLASEATALCTLAPGFASSTHGDALQRSLRGLVDLTEAQAAFRLPIPDVEELPGVPTRFSRFVPLPREMPSMGALIGRSTDGTSGQDVRILTDDRRRHCYIVGQSGTGKSTLFLGMALDDIRAGSGVCVIDPHGDLVEDILLRYPKERADDLVLFEPSNVDRPVGLNLLEWSEPDEKAFLVQELVGIVMKLFPIEMTGPIFERNFRNALLTLMANRDEPGTILEVPRLFADKDYHKRYLAHIDDPQVRLYWEKEMAEQSAHTRSEITGYLTSKFERFSSDPLMRNIVGQAHSTFRIDEVMQQGKVLLVNLSKGEIGEINSSLLGCVVVAKLQSAAMARAKLAQDDRRDFYLYVDEFQSFATPRFTTLLSEARKFRLNMVLTNQYLQQLRTQNASEDVLSAVLGNVGTFIAMRVGPEDAGVLERQFAPVFRASDLLTLPNWHAYVNMLVDGQRVRPFSMRTVKDPTEPNRMLATGLSKLSALKYGRDKLLVEMEIAQRWR